MKKVAVNNKLNQSFGATLEDPTEWIADCVANNYWGKPERWVRAKELVFAINGEQTFYYADGEYEDADVLRTEVRLTGNVIPDTDPIEREPETWVELKAEYTIEIEDYVYVPQKITRRQAKLILLQFGLLDDIETYINDPITDRKVKIEWAESLEFHRNWETLIQVATSMGMTSQQIDTLFIEGAKL